jgi:hypothetical protein
MSPDTELERSPARKKCSHSKHRQKVLGHLLRAMGTIFGELDKGGSDMANASGLRSPKGSVSTV